MGRRKKAPSERNKEGNSGVPWQAAVTEVEMAEEGVWRGGDGASAVPPAGAGLKPVDKSGGGGPLPCEASGKGYILSSVALSGRRTGRRVRGCQRWRGRQ